MGNLLKAPHGHGTTCQAGSRCMQVIIWCGNPFIMGPSLSDERLACQARRQESLKICHFNPADRGERNAQGGANPALVLYVDAIIQEALNRRFVTGWEWSFPMGIHSALILLRRLSALRRRSLLRSGDISIIVAKRVRRSPVFLWSFMAVPRDLL